MTKKERAAAVMYIAQVREELNRDLAYKTRYDAEGHNICLAWVRYKDGTDDLLVSYSNDSAISESIRHGRLQLVPDVSPFIPEAHRFGCKGRGQYHTEPKLLNYLCATPDVRKCAYTKMAPPKDPFLRYNIAEERSRAVRRAELKHPDEIASVILVTEINCCKTCTKYAIERFEQRYPHILEIIELGKDVGAGTPPRYKDKGVTIS